MKKFITIMLAVSLLIAFEAQAVGLSVRFNLTGDQDGELFGYPTRFVGDVNNDSYEDVAVGSLGYDVGGASDVGRVQIFSGQTGVLIREHTQPFTTAASSSAFFGSALTGIGDVNADGFADYVIMDPRFSTGEGGATVNERGRVIAYSGQTGGTLWTYTGTVNSQFQFGNTLAVSVRDFSGDGLRDVAVGAPALNGGDGAILILNAANGAVVTQYNGIAGSATGVSFDTGFDINGDGTEDFIVGEPFTSGVEVFEGAVRIISGTDFSTIRTVAGPSGDRFAVFGLFVQLSSDSNNDSRADFFASSREDVGGQRNVGAIRTFSGLTGDLLKLYQGSEREELFGTSLANLGDVNNDGYADVSSAGLAASNGAGRADVYQSKAGIKWDQAPGGAAGDAQGSDIDGGRDIGSPSSSTKDGVPDLILGSTGGQVGPISPGRARIVVGDPKHVPAGSSIEVRPDLSRRGTAVTFPTVTADGNISYTYSPVSGANFQTKQGAGVEQWSITTNAVFGGTIAVCLQYNPARYSDETKIDLQYRVGGAGGFSTVTLSRDTVGNVVCGTTATL